VLTICKVLPLYKAIQQHLESAIADPDLTADDHGLANALAAGLVKINIYLNKALVGHYPLLGAVLHPSIRLAYFEDLTKWAPSISIRARVLLEHLYDTYHDDSTATSTAPTSTKPLSASGSIFLEAIRNPSPSQKSALATEIELYFSGAYPCSDGNLLVWWKKHAGIFPILSRIARDVLAVPGVSISVERLFSSSKHTLSDARSSMTAESASKTVVTKEWLKKGLGDGVDYLDGCRLHN
jgi:hypothetical protein